MKKVLGLLLSFALALCLTACSNAPENKTDRESKMVEEAIQELEKAWADVYVDDKITTDTYFEIKIPVSLQ